MKFLNTLALTCIATSAIADTTLTYTSKKDKEVMKMQFSGNMMRATSVDDNSSFMIYDGNNKTFTMFANDEKKYYVLDEEAARRCSAAASLSLLRCSAISAALMIRLIIR
mgnify:CR=1 FL=1